MVKDNNIGLIEPVYAAYAQGNSQFILDRITDDVDWINEGPDSIPYAGTFKGPADVRRFFEALGSSVDGGRVTADDWIVQNDKVVATGRFTSSEASLARLGREGKVFERSFSGEGGAQRRKRVLPETRKANALARAGANAPGALSLDQINSAKENA